MEPITGYQTSGKFLRKRSHCNGQRSKAMELSYETNPGTNYIASKLSETAMLKLRDNIASKVTETYTETVFDSISEAGDGMQEAADGSGKDQRRTEYSS